MTRPKRDKEYCVKCRGFREYTSKEELVEKDDITYRPIITRCLICGSEIWMPSYCKENMRRYEEALKEKNSE